MRKLRYGLRWLAVLPGGFVGGALLTFPLHWTLYQTLSNFVEPYPALPERILSPLVIALGFVWLGARIAPARKIETAVVLFGLWMILLGGVLAFTLFVGQIGSHQVFFVGGGLGTVAAFFGSLIGLLIVRHESRSSLTVTLQPIG